MGRGRTKGKKLLVTSQDDPGSGEDEKIPAQKKRGRPQKSLKEDEIDEEEASKIEVEEEGSEDTIDAANKDLKSKTVTQNGKKRKRNAQEKEKASSVKEENGNGTRTRSTTEESHKSNGFRQNGNRRKNKPHRAAEAVVECN